MDEARELRVGVVDDDPDHRFLMSRRLKSAGFTVESTDDPASVLERLGAFDVLLLDYRIPGTSGVDVIGEIVARDGPPVVMVTGMGSEAVAVEALQAGAAGYIVKSNDYLDELPEVVMRAWTQREASRRSDALQGVAQLVTSATDTVEVVAGITAGAKQVLGADDVELIRDAVLPRTVHPPEGPTARLEVPIVSRTGEPLGVLVVHSAVPRIYTPGDYELAQSFAAFAAIGLTNADQLRREREAVGELRDTLDLRRQLVATVGHELRTPLTSIAGFSATLLRHWDSFGDQERRDMVARIERNSADLTDIVSRLMDYAYMDSGHIEPLIEDVELEQFVREIIDALDASLVGASVNVMLDGLSARADRTLLRRVVVNLLTNAQKYGGDDPEITLWASAADGRVRVAVTDNGPGIEAEDLPKVFDAFWRSDRDRHRRQGTGIGLALVHDYVRLMGGAVGVESPAGEGATFFFTLSACGAQASGST